MTATPQSLLDAYVAATSLPVSMSYQREVALSELCQRGITPDDVRAVLRELKRRVNSSRREDECYTATCLEFRCCMANADKFEERALTLRQRELRKPKPRPAVQATGPDGMNRLVDAPPAEAKVIDASAALRGLADTIDKSKTA